MINLKELDKLEQYLSQNNYKYNRRKNYDGAQLMVYNEDGEELWDVICCSYSYGHKRGLLEAMGSYIIAEDKDEVEGYLSAEEIIQRLENMND